MPTPVERLLSELLRRRIPVVELTGGSTALNIEFSESISATQRAEAFRLIADWDWSWTCRKEST